MQQVAQQAVNAAHAAAASNPQAAKLLDTAHDAVSKATAAYHVTQTVANAAAGDADAQKQVAELADAAAQGDPAAQAAAQLASQVTDAASANVQAATEAVSGALPLLLGLGGLGYLGLRFYEDRQAAQLADRLLAEHGIKRPGPAADSFFASVSPASPVAVVQGVTDLRELAAAAASAQRGRVIGVVVPRDNPTQVHVFNTPDEADDWYGQWMSVPHAIEYIAYYDKSDSTFPGPLNEQFGATATAAMRGAIASSTGAIYARGA